MWPENAHWATWGQRGSRQADRTPAGCWGSCWGIPELAGAVAATLSVPSWCAASSSPHQGWQESSEMGRDGTDPPRCPLQSWDGKGDVRLVTMRLKLSKGARDTRAALWVEVVVGSARELHVPAAQMPTVQLLPGWGWLRQLCTVLNYAAQTQPRWQQQNVRDLGSCKAEPGSSQSAGSSWGTGTGTWAWGGAGTVPIANVGLIYPGRALLLGDDLWESW